MTASLITIFGAIVATVGGALLYFYEKRRKKVGGVIIDSDGVAYEFHDEKVRNKPPQEWERQADIFINRISKIKRLGFTLVIFGSALQILSVIIAEFY
jgi:hypothetical protein